MVQQTRTAHKERQAPTIDSTKHEQLLFEIQTGVFSVSKLM